jgi:major intrinsic protein
VKQAVNNTGPLSTPKAASVSDTLGVAASLRLHWPEYLMEAGEMSLFMFCTCSFATLLQHPASPVRHFFISGIVRRALMGLAIGATVMALIMSPWGKQSGGHINPAMTFAFYRLGKLRPWDALFYGVAQFSGATSGVALATFLLKGAPGDGTVRYAVTAPWRVWCRRRVCSRASHLFDPDDHGTACDEPRKVGAVHALFCGFALRREHHV